MQPNTASSAMPSLPRSCGSESCLPITEPKTRGLTRASVLTAYRRMAPVYDWMFGACFEPGRRRAIERLAGSSGRDVLEVGVGTGLSLRHWPREMSVTGIDLSPEMLARAERARARHRLENVTLRRMDAQAMDFPDDRFDKVAVMYVVSVVPDLGMLLREIRRVCRPGGRICIVNHFQRRNRFVRRLESALSAHAGFLGFDAALPIERITRAEGLDILRVRPVNWGGYWSLIEAKNVK